MIGILNSKYKNIQKYTIPKITHIQGLSGRVMRNKWQPKIILKFPRLSTSAGALHYIVYAYSPALKTLEIPQTVQMSLITSGGETRDLAPRAM